MDWNHIHLATSHIPIIGSLFCMIFWIIFSIKKDLNAQRIVVFVILFTSLAGIAVKFTGDPASEKVAAEESIIKSHEDWADRATTGLFFWLLASIWGVIQTRNKKPFNKVSFSLITIFGLITMALLAVAANYGGQINHESLR